VLSFTIVRPYPATDATRAPALMMSADALVVSAPLVSRHRRNKRTACALVQV
jgi:hypothetical protein